MQLDGIVKALGLSGTARKAQAVMRGIDASVTKLSDWISPSLAVEVATKRIKAEDKQRLVRTRARALAHVVYEPRTYIHAQSRTITCDDANCSLSLPPLLVAGAGGVLRPSAGGHPGLRRNVRSTRRGHRR